MGARPDRDGVSGIHTHMTNSWNSPIEVLEHAYPVRVLHYGFRARSGGDGLYRGGDGLIREVELLTDMQVGLLCDRRKRGPYGLSGGTDGKPGHNELRIKGTRKKLPGKCAFYAPAGAVVRIESPGGGGWGKRKRR
jgi:N-methylhydantoinase B